ncbi:c-type cytochrome [Hymenobacter metallicola]|uniref:Cytochrome c n=1 Tax=Hymenobacter metallicola TaxID=2563114 RepID=A0A4Z0QB86_9BACT|nr:cytochrome c [Hymenobacter metallicola]TGE27348.1 cytochrome c [Hymenobacter metallicola]
MIRFASFLFSALALFGLGSACSSAGSSEPEETAAAAPPPTAELPGKALYTQNCVVCHGPDGKLGLNGAHDLTKSNLNATGRVYMVTQGLGKMPSFKNQLTEEQIQQVVAYSLTLK